jgi:holo-ACP synthase
MDILQAREQRWRTRQDLARRFRAPVLTLRLNIPGPDKNPPGAEQALARLWDALLARYRRAFVAYRRAIDAHGVSPARLEGTPWGAAPRLKPDAPNLVPYLYREHGADADGPFRHLVSPLPAPLLKLMAVRLENAHPLGRLADADVLDADGRVLSRADADLPPRACFVCSEPAALCRRLGRHAAEAAAFVRTLLEQART